MNKIITFILTATMLISSIPVFASGSYNILDTSPQISSQYITLSLSECIEKIRGLIDEINKMRKEGTVEDDYLISLAKYLYALDNKVSESDNGVGSDVESIVNEAEECVKSLKGDSANKAWAAVGVVRSSLNISPPENEVRYYHTKDIGNLKGFYDLYNHEWARAAIFDMSVGKYKGLFSGKTEPNEMGVAMFDPDGAITRAEFIAVVTRVLYSEVLATMPGVSAKLWYANNYDVAVAKGLIKESEFEFDDTLLNSPMPREEMALILVRACEQCGEYIRYLADTSEIPDYNLVSDPYKKSVLEAFSAGLIKGKNINGLFAPHDTLTRAESATVLFRLVKKTGITSNAVFDNNIPIVIHEWQYGRSRSDRNAREGDVFIKTTGEQIVLTKDQYGILGGGQGVAPDVGLSLSHGYGGNSIIGRDGTDNNGFRYDRETYGILVDSTGNDIFGQRYYINATTGEGYWKSEYQRLSENIPVPDRNGAYMDEVSPDSYHLYKWYGDVWVWNYIR